MKLRVSLISLVVVSIFLVSGVLASPRVYAFANGENATTVLGYNNFTSRDAIQPPNASSVSGPAGIAFDATGNLWVVDGSNSRVLEFKTPLSSGESASTVLGESDFITSGGFSSANQTNLNIPFGLAFDSSGNLWVSDSSNNRIVEFKAPFSNGETESLVLGQANFTGSNSATTQTNLNSPRGIAFDSSGNLWAADLGNSRVVEFKAPLSTGESESLVIGQTNFTSGIQDIPGCPQSCATQTSAASLNQPYSVAFDSSGNLWVTDPKVGNLAGRVLEYNAPLSTGESASMAIGVTGVDAIPGLNCFNGVGANCLGFPDYLAFDKSGNLWINDDTGGRVLEFPHPFSFNESASIVIGQPNFTAGEPNGPVNASISAFYGADGIALDSSGNLWVSAGLQNRILEFPASTVGNSSTSSTAGASSSTTTASSTVSTTSVSVPATSASLSVSQTPTTSTTSSVIVPPPTTAAASTSSSSSTSISLNYLLVVGVVGIVMVGTLAVFRRKT
jgi:sugar lactone lactonase YvrE